MAAVSPGRSEENLGALTPIHNKELAKMTYRTKFVYLQADQTPQLADVMALVHKLSYLDAIAFAKHVGGDVDKIAGAAEAFMHQWHEENDQKPPLPYPQAPEPAPPVQPASWGGR